MKYKFLFISLVIFVFFSSMLNNTVISDSIINNLSDDENSCGKGEISVMVYSYNGRNLALYSFVRIEVKGLNNSINITKQTLFGYATFRFLPIGSYEVSIVDFRFKKATNYVKLTDEKIKVEVGFWAQRRESKFNDRVGANLFENKLLQNLLQKLSVCNYP